MLSYLRNVREADRSRLDSEPWLEVDEEGAIGCTRNPRWGEVEINAQHSQKALSKVSRRELRPDKHGSMPLYII